MSPRADELTRGVVVPLALPPTPRGRPREALVLRDAAGEIRVYLNRCRHLPIPLDGGSGDYLSSDRAALFCGTHGARYRLEDGVCTEGPCRGEALVALPFELVDGRVELKLAELDELDFGV